MSKSALVRRPPTPDPEDTDKEFKLEEKIRYQLAVSGERERLKKLLVQRLESCGWRDNIKQRTREYVLRKGRDTVTTEDIVRAIRPEGRATVPDAVKSELLAEIKKFINSIV